VSEATSLSARDLAQLDAWLAECAAAPGQLPAGVEPVQTRLVRAVGRGQLPDTGPVFFKVMAFPRRADRLRYWLRALPAQHEAAMLCAARAAGVACPEVLAVVAQRGGLGRPRLSVLVTRGLDLLPEQPPGLSACAVLAGRLCAAGVVHPDLHAGNFLSLRDGRTAVLDLQSARRARLGVSLRRRRQLAVRLLAADWPQPEVATALLPAGLINAAQLPAAVGAAAAWRAAAQRRRVARCLVESTEFAVQRRFWGVLRQRRELRAGGEWVHGGRGLRQAWLGARYREVMHEEPSQLGALFCNWWWLPARCSVYIQGSDGVALFEAKSPQWLEAYGRFQDMTGGGSASTALGVDAPLPWTGRREV
jgi:hypothetical protein